jgi:hypothetical protein
MPCNVGGIERIARITVGIVLLIVGFTVPMSSTWQIVAFVLGAIGLGTGLIKYCPLNSVFGFNTCKSKEQTST